MKYARKSTAPEWFDRHEPLHFSATSGSHPFNEWYAFDDRADAIASIDSLFSSNSFADNMTIVDGVLYYSDEIRTDSNGVIDWISESATTDDFGAAVSFESPF